MIGKKKLFWSIFVVGTKVTFAVHGMIRTKMKNSNYISATGALKRVLLPKDLGYMIAIYKMNSIIHMIWFISTVSFLLPQDWVVLRGSPFRWWVLSSKGLLGEAVYGVIIRHKVIECISQQHILCIKYLPVMILLCILPKPERFLIILQTGIFNKQLKKCIKSQRLQLVTISLTL